MIQFDNVVARETANDEHTPTTEGYQDLNIDAISAQQTVYDTISPYLLPTPSVA